MLRRLFLVLGLAPFSASAGWLNWRLHVWCRVHCHNGPVITVVVRGELAKLTEAEREFLDKAAELMAAL